MSSVSSTNRTSLRSLIVRPRGARPCLLWVGCLVGLVLFGAGWPGVEVAGLECCSAERALDGFRIHLFVALGALGLLNAYDEVSEGLTSRLQSLSVEVVMTASVRVSRRTLQVLNKLKQEEGLRSHDQVIRELISRRKKIPRSTFGSNPKLRSFTAKEEAESHE